MKTPALKKVLAFVLGMIICVVVANCIYYFVFGDKNWRQILGISFLVSLFAMCSVFWWSNGKE